MIKSADLAWIVTSDVKKARKFFTETLGLKEHSYAEEYGWVEVRGPDGGLTIGIGQMDEESDVLPGGNAVITFTVNDLNATIEEFKKKNVTLLGEVIEVPGHVRMQMFTDNDGNKF